MPVVYCLFVVLKVLRVFKKNFFVFRLVDNLPVATKVVDPETKEESYKIGYRLGEFYYNEALITNHLHIILYYHANADGWVGVLK